MKRLIPLAAVLAGLAWFVPAAKAADLDARRTPRARAPAPPPPVDIFEEPDVPILTRPVVGFYAYPYDTGVPRSRVLAGEPATQEPYAIRNDPHGVAVR